MAIKSKTDIGKIRHLAGATAFSMAVLSGSVYGLGLGSIELGSALNQPFSAEIEVLTDIPGEAENLAVQLASQEAFMRAGIERPRSLSKLSFSMSKRDGRSFIVVSSNDPISEPFLNFLVEVDWERGSLVREYTVLLDPPTYITDTPSTTVAGELAEVGDDQLSDPSLPARIERGEEVAVDYSTTTLTEEEMAAELEAVNFELSEQTSAAAAEVVAADELIDELREVDDLMVVANAAAVVPSDAAEAVEAVEAVGTVPVEAEVQTVTAAAEQAPVLEEVGDSEIFGSTAEVAVEEPARSYTETVVEDMESVLAALDREVAGDAPAKAVAAPAPAAVTATGKTLDPVRRGQTLWSIASANRVSGVSVEQMMVALLRANPKAFEDGNINALNRGAILRVPTAAEVGEMDRNSALTSVNEQNALWKKYRDQARAKPVEAQQGESNAGVAIVTETAEAAEPATAAEDAKRDTTPENDGKLTLLADTDEAKVGEGETVEANTAVTAESVARLAELRNQLNLAQEEAETERQRAEEMSSRVSDLEAAVGKMNALLELRNAELSKLQSAVTAGRSEAEAEAARQLAESQAEMQRQLELVKVQAAEQAEAAAERRAATESEIAALREKLLASGEATEAVEAQLAAASEAAKAAQEAAAKASVEAAATAKAAEDAANKAVEQANAAAAQAAEEATAAAQAAEEAASKAVDEANEAATKAAEEAAATAKAAEEAANKAVEEANAAATKATEEAAAAAQAAQDAASKAVEEANAVAAKAAEDAAVAAEKAVAEATEEATKAAEDAAAAADAAEAEASRVAEEAAAEAAKLAETEAAAVAEAEAAKLAAEATTLSEPVPEEAGKEAWWKPYLNAEYAKYAGGAAVVGLGLWALLGRGRKREEEEIFADENYVTPDDTSSHSTVDYVPEEVEEYDETEASYDETAYGHTAIADELNDETVDATDLTALDATLTEGAPDAANVDILQEADVYLSYGLADRAEELLDGAIAANPQDEMLQAKRLEALFVKQDGVSFETAAIAYHGSFGGEQAPHWPKISSWGAALAPASNLFQGVEPASLDETQDITTLDTTRLAGGAAAVAAGASGLAASLGDSAESAIGDAIDTGADFSAQAEDGLSLTSVQLEDALDNTTDSVSVLGGDLSAAAGDALPDLDDIELGDLGGDLSSELGSELDAGLDGVDLSADLSDGLDGLEATGVSLGDDLESMSAGLEDDLEMTDLEATLAGDGDLEDMLEATGADDFELSLADEGVGAGGGLSGEISMGDLESELLNTDATGSLGGLSEEIDFEAAGLSLSDETTDADLTVTGDEVDTMLDLARAYIDMGDADSANSTLNEILATGNAEQVEAAKELQSQLG